MANGLVQLRDLGLIIHIGLTAKDHDIAIENLAKCQDGRDSCPV